VTVYDRWHKSRSRPGEEKCGDHRKVPTADHGKGDRWQVRWRDEQGSQRKQSFAKKTEAEVHAAKVATQLADGSYVDPKAGQVTFRSFAEDWRKNRVHDATTAERVEANLRNHVYSEDGKGGRTPRGGVSIGDYPMRILARRPSLIQSWLKGIPMAPNSQLLVIGYVSQVFRAAVADKIIAANPLHAGSVQLPDPVRTEAVPWTAVQVAAVAAELPARLAALPYLGAACGLRQGELIAAAVSDVDFLRKTLHVEVQVKRVGGEWWFAPVKNHKTCKYRDIPLDDPLPVILAEHVRLYPPGAVTLPWHDPRDKHRHGKPVTRALLFTHQGGQVHRNAFNWWWRKAWQAAGIPDPGPRLNGCHVLRHTAASAWLSGGLNIAKVAALLGDTKEVVLRTYAHFMPEDDDQARAIMKAFFSAMEDAGDGQCAPDVPGALR
jgi:integrase